VAPQSQSLMWGNPTLSKWKWVRERRREAAPQKWGTSVEGEAAE